MPAHGWELVTVDMSVCARVSQMRNEKSSWHFSSLIELRHSTDIHGAHGPKPNLGQAHIAGLESKADGARERTYRGSRCVRSSSFRLRTIICRMDAFGTRLNFAGGVTTSRLVIARSSSSKSFLRTSSRRFSRSVASCLCARLAPRASRIIVRIESFVSSPELSGNRCEVHANSCPRRRSAALGRGGAGCSDHWRKPVA